MARWSGRVGPSANILPATAGTELDSPRITRHFDDGNILVFVTGTATNTGAAVRAPLFRLFLDGFQPIGTADYVFSIPAGARITYTLLGLINVAPGIHTLSIFCAADTAADQRINANETIFGAIQLPQWDADADLTW